MVEKGSQCETCEGVVGDVGSVMNQDELNSNILNRPEVDKIVFNKAKKEEVAVIKTQDDEGLDNSFSYVDWANTEY